jgi:PAS domain S-box-containing protein
MTPSADAAGARYRALFDTTPDGIMIVDDLGVYVDLNDAMCAMLGGSREQLLGRHFSDFIPPDRLDEAVADFAVLRGEGALAIEFPIRRIDGALLNLEWRSRSNFVPGLHFCIARDLSARDTAQRALRESEERYRAFVANSSEAIWRFELEEPVSIDTDSAGQIELFYRLGYLAECNETMAAQYGFSAPSDLIGARLGDLVVRDDPANLEYLRAFIASGYRLIDAESREVDREGNEKYFANNLIGIIEHGRLLRAWGTQRDITEQRASALRLESANRAKDEFLAMLSHELRTPMTATLGWGTMLQSGLDAAGTRTAADAIVQATRAQAHLIDDLLDISRIVSGKMQLTVRDTRLGDVLGAAVETVRAAADAKQIAIEVRGDTDVRVNADQERLQQIFWNLLSNAVKFTPRGGHVTVVVERVEGTARVLVRDDGEGIDAELLPYIFDRFRQGDSGASRKFGGLGLGLSIAKNLAELHGGTVVAASDGRGQGAELTLSLPLGTPSGVRESPLPDSSTARPLHGISLLLVEDDLATRGMLEMALRRFGAEVFVAGDADEAIQLLGANRFRILISDIGLPGQDGCALLAGVRGSGNDVPAIALTAYASPSERQRALGAGFNRWLAKPVDLDTLAAEILTLSS